MGRFYNMLNNKKNRNNLVIIMSKNEVNTSLDEQEDVIYDTVII